MCGTGGLSSRCEDLLCERLWNVTFNLYVNVQLVKRHIVTAAIYCYITTEFHYAKGDSRCLSLLGFSPCKFWQVLVYLSKYLILLFPHFKEPKNSLELPNPTRNICKCSNTFGQYFWWNKLAKQAEYYLPSSESETCNVSALSGWRNTIFSVCNIPFESNASIKPEKCISQTVKTK